MVGFRNIIAHDYEKIDYTVVSTILQSRLKDIHTFLKKIDLLDLLAFIGKPIGSFLSWAVLAIGSNEEGGELRNDAILVVY